MHALPPRPLHTRASSHHDHPQEAAADAAELCERSSGPAIRPSGNVASCCCSAVLRRGRWCGYSDRHLAPCPNRRERLCVPLGCRGQLQLDSQQMLCARSCSRLARHHPRHQTSQRWTRRCCCAGMADGEGWRQNLIRDAQAIQQLALGAKRVAVLGIKTEQQAGQPAFFVAKYLADAGVDVVPVPVFYPDVTHILGQRVFRKVADVPGQIDIVDVFRKPSDVLGHVDDILAARPKAVWLQSGITCPEAEEAFARAGIKVVSDACLKVEHQQAVMFSKM